MKNKTNKSGFITGLINKTAFKEAGDVASMDLDYKIQRWQCPGCKLYLRGVDDGQGLFCHKCGTPRPKEEAPPMPPQEEKEVLA